MIKFFRTIRQDLTIESKVSKYILYALGEIFLVMIGILLAVNINNWNTQRQERSKEQVLLKSIKNDFERNISELSNILDYNDNTYYAALALLDLISSEPNQFSQANIDSLVGSLILFKIYDPYTGAIDEAISTGSLNLIKDQGLKSQLSGWTAELDDSYDDVKFMINFYENRLLPYLIQNFALRNTPIPDYVQKSTGLKAYSKSKIEIDYRKVMQSLEFENLLAQYAINLAYMKYAYQLLGDFMLGTEKMLGSNITQ